VKDCDPAAATRVPRKMLGWLQTIVKYFWIYKWHSTTDILTILLASVDINYMPTL